MDKFLNNTSNIQYFVVLTLSSIRYINLTIMLLVVIIIQKKNYIRLTVTNEKVTKDYLTIDNNRK